MRDVHCTGAGLIVSHGFDIASSGKWRQNQIAPSTAKPALCFEYLNILCLLLIQTQKKN